MARNSTIESPVIYIAGYPKSGTTWITRLLGDVLDCRTGGSTPLEDEIEIATEGLSRKTNLVVRKGHFVLDNEESKYPVLRKHTLNWKALDPEKHKVVFVIRDPRDIAVSGAFHWETTIQHFIRDMYIGKGAMRSVGSWTVYVKTWLSKYKDIGFVIVRYENMLKDHNYLGDLLDKLQYDISSREIQESYNRQRFENRVNDIKHHGHSYNLGKDFNLKFMRKGIAEDWRNYLSPNDAFDCEISFGELLRSLKYESDPEWWRKHSLSLQRWRELQWNHQL